MPLNRVQAVTVTWPLLWRTKGWLRLRLEVAGYSAGELDDRNRPDRLLPVGDADTGATVVAEVLPGVRLDALPTAERAWVIDPVDGTRNFSRGSPDFAVMLAEVHSGETVRGWIWQPVHGRLYVAERGGGVRCNGEPMAPAEPGREVPLGATYVPLRSDDACELEVRRSWGSCGIDYPKLLHGEVDFLTYRSMFPWDHLPGGLMVDEFGGLMASDAGVPYRPGVIGRRLIAVVDPGIWPRVRDALAGTR